MGCRLSIYDVGGLVVVTSACSRIGYGHFLECGGASGHEMDCIDNIDVTIILVIAKMTR